MKKVILVLIMLLLVTGCGKEETIVNDVIKSEKTPVKEELNIIEDEELAINKNVEVNSEEEFVTYMENVSNEVDTIALKSELNNDDKMTLKNTFITLTDFIFYGGTIKGKTFDELTESAKIKVIDVYNKIDSKIESKFPGYKETIKDTSTKVYTNVVEKSKEMKNSIINSYKEKYGEEAYNQRVDAYNEGKENMKEVYEIYKPGIDKAKEKAKDVYQSTKEKLNNWYQEYKESSE